MAQTDILSEEVEMLEGEAFHGHLCQHIFPFQKIPFYNI